jgi:hypothetical protein
VFHGSVFTNHNSQLVDYSHFDLLDDDPVQSSTSISQDIVYDDFRGKVIIEILYVLL